MVLYSKGDEEGFFPKKSQLFFDIFKIINENAILLKHHQHCT